MKRIASILAIAAGFGSGASDARSDFAYQSPSTGEVRRMLFDGTVVLPGGGPSSELTSAWKVVGQGDFTGEGSVDLLYRNESTGQVKLLSWPNIWYTRVDNVYSEPNLGWKIVLTPDLDGDGKSDILWWNSITGQVFAMLMNGNAIAAQGSIYTEPDRNWRIVAAGDFAGTGKSNQLLWRHLVTGQVYLMTVSHTAAGFSQSGTMIYTEPNPAWQIVGAADVSGDGRSDIVWRNESSGEVYVMLMNGAAIESQAMVYVEPNLAWKIVAMEDYSRSGKSQLLWRHDTTGQVYAMRMNGLAAPSGAVIFTEPDTSWKVMGPTEIRKAAQGQDFTRCPATYVPQNDLGSARLGGYGNPLLRMQKSREVVAIPLPGTGVASTGVVQFSESAGGAYTPQPVSIEISISKCPGQILPEVDEKGARDYCALRSSNGNYNAITWFGKAFGAIASAQMANLYGYCWAGDPDEKYYINARWTYNSCAFGAAICGFAIQQNQGPY